MGLAKKLAMSVMLAGFSGLLYAGEGDYHTLSIQNVYGRHSADSSKKNQNFTAIEYNKAYLEQYGYGLKLTFGGAEYDNGSKLEQNQADLSAWKLYTPDHFPTSITLFTNLSFIDNNDSLTQTGAMTLFALGAAFAAQDNSYALTPSYSYSQYGSSFTVSQYDLSMGFAFNNQWDWFQYRPALIQLSDATITGKDQYIGHYLSWTHYMMDSSSWLGLQSFSVTAKSGDTVFSVDTASKSVYNLKDASQYALGLDLAFAPALNQKVLLGSGVEAFNGFLSNKDYSLAYVYLQYIINWH